MSAALPVWLRPHYQGPGGRPLLFYIVYGDFGKLPSLSTSQYRSAGLPDGFELSHHERGSEGFSHSLEGFVWNQFRADDPKLPGDVEASPGCLILRGEIEDCDNLNYLRDCVGLLTFLLDNGGIAICDHLMFHWWTPKVWRERVFEPAGPVPRHHVVILTSEESDPDLTWFHTRGMRKFGRPDLSIHHVPAEYHDAIIDLFERFIELQGFGGVIVEGQEIRMRSLPEGMTCHHGGDLDDPDFNNVHVEITWG